MPRLTRVLSGLMFIIAAVLLTFLSLAAPAQGQRRADPEPLDTRTRGPDIRGFAEAYARANEPEMIVICGIVAGGPQAGERNLAAVDTHGDSDALRRRIEELLLEARVELIEQSSLDAVKRRELNLLAQQGEGRVIEALKEKFNADVAIKIEMQPRDRDAKYRVTVDTLSVTRGRKIGTFAFDWEQGDDARSVKAYGDAVVRKVIDQFINFYLPGDRQGAEMRYTVLLVGVEDNRAVKEISRAFATVPGVSKVQVRGNTDAGGRKAASMEVRFTGTMFDLAVDLEDAASRLLNLKVDGTDANSGTITLIAQNKALPPVAQRDPCEELFDPNSERHELFKEKYKADGRPRITILINREVFQGERQNQEHAKNFKFVGPPPGATTHPLLVTATAENSIADYFKKLDARIVNADQVRKRVERAANKAGGVFKDDELVQLLKDQDVADIVVLGRGGSVGKGTGVWYTFEATRIGGDNLGNTRWTSEVDGRNLAAVDQAFELLGRDVTCALAQKMVSEWKGNKRVDVVVTGVKNARAVQIIMDQLKDGFDGIVSADFGGVYGGAQAGTGKFSLEYNSSYDDLARKIAELAEDSGTFSVESTSRESLTLKAGPGVGTPKQRKAAVREPEPSPQPEPADAPPVEEAPAADAPATEEAASDKDASSVPAEEPTAASDAQSTKPEGEELR